MNNKNAVLLAFTSSEWLYNKNDMKGHFLCIAKVDRKNNNAISL
jgi:hypothetical protein